MARNSLITEGDIFKYVIGDHGDLSDSASLENTRFLVERIPSNIFRDEYAIMYQALVWGNKNKMPLTRVVLQELMANSKRDLLTNPKVEMHRDISDEDRRYDEIENDTLALYDVLLYEEVTDDRMQGQTNLYIETWFESEMNTLVYEMSEIMTRGLRVGNVTYQGAEDSNLYYRKKFELIETILHDGKNNLAEDLYTGELTGVEIQERVEEAETDAEIIAYMGLPTMDDELQGFKKGETVVIQGGSGVGKTRLSIGSIAYSALKLGKKVLHISLEQLPTRIMPIYLSRHIVDSEGTLPQLDDRGIMQKTYSPQYESNVQEAYFDLSSENEDMGTLALVGRDLKATEIEEYLESVYDRFKFDVVILDYFGNLTTEGSANMYAEYRHAVGYLKSACKNFRGVGFLSIIVNQLKAETEKELIAGNTEASKLGGADSQDLVRAADVMMTIYQSPEMKEENKMRLLVDKVRLGSVPDIDMFVDLGRALYIEDEDEEEIYV